MTSFKKLTNRRKIRAASLIFLSSLFLIACEEKQLPPGKTVASVDNVRLSERELNEIMNAHAASSGEKKQIVNNWIEEQVYYNEAKEKGLLDKPDAKVLADENLKQIAKALLIDEFIRTRDFTVTDEEARKYYEEHGGEFLAGNNALILDFAELNDLQQALKFRELAIRKNWQTAVSVLNARTERNKFLFENELTPPEAMRSAKYLPENEISPVIKNFDGKFFVFRITKRIDKGEILPFDAVGEKIRKRLEMEKKAAMFKEYKEEIFGNHKIEFYGDINE